MLPFCGAGHLQSVRLRHAVEPTAKNVRNGAARAACHSSLGHFRTLAAEYAAMSKRPVSETLHNTRHPRALDRVRCPDGGTITIEEGAPRWL